MKRKTDPRHLARRAAVQSLFAESFVKQKGRGGTAKLVLDNLGQIDGFISHCAPEWPIEKINKIDLAILRLAVYELVIDKTQPPKVIIDEAVELAKEFGQDTSPSFVNGVLGAVVEKADGRTKKRNY
ncbi:transcription antitermination factor NusB [Candidatus Microgenomates bacterium]|nr:transcription antitermination factor NusB [Candidatus Microgenomates bacterium]